MKCTIREVAIYLRSHSRLASLVLCLTLAPGTVVVADMRQDVAAGSRPAVKGTVDAGRLTLETDGAPLAEVLRAIGEAGSFRVVLRGELAKPVNRSFIDEPLEDAIRQLVEGHSVVILHDDPDPATGIAGVAEIRVIENPARAASEAVDTESRPADPQVSSSEADFAMEEPTDPVEEEYRQAVFEYTPPIKDDLLMELDEADAAARLVAIPKVGALRPEEAIDVISHVFSSEEDATVRSRAVAALTRLDGSASRGLLRERALKDEDPGLRMQALNALASSRGDRAMNILAQALRQDPEPRVRMSAIRALGRIGGDWARRYLEGAARDLHPEVSLAAEQALADWPD